MIAHTPLINSILRQKKYVLMLMKRVALINHGYSSKTAYERNESDIRSHESYETIMRKLLQIQKLEKELSKEHQNRKLTAL
jgi:hypothetical protein